MNLVITIPEVDDSYMSVTNRLADAFESMAVLNSIASTNKWVTPNCLVVSFSSSFLTTDVIEERLLAIYYALYESLPESQVSVITSRPDAYFRFLNINVSLKAKF